MKLKSGLRRAYALLEIKSVDETARKFTGIASSSSTDRMGDIVMPEGAKFKLPLPLLWQHDSGDPIGHIVSAKVRKGAGVIEIEGEIPQISDNPALAERLNLAWSYLKNKLVRGLSIGFNPLKWEPIDDTYGYRFLEWDWLELSAVTIPANQDASITLVRSLARAQRAALGPMLRTPSSRPGIAPGVTGISVPTKRGTVMKLKEQIAALEALRKQKSDRMQAIMEKAATEGRSTNEEEGQEFDDLQAEVATADADLERFRKLEKIQLVKATEVASGAGVDPAAALRVRGGSHIEVRSNLPKGTGFVRYAMCLANGKGNLSQAVELSKRYRDSTPEVEEVLKSAIAAGTTTDATWAGPLVVYQNLVNEFIELLRPATIVGRLPGLRRVPFNVRMPKQTGGGSYGWVGEGAPKPVGKLAFGEVTLKWAKAAGIIVISEELARLSNPAAEGLVRQDMIDGIAQFLDGQFVDPAVAAVADVSPASITNGITNVVGATGTDAAAVRADVGTLFQTMLQNNIVPTNGAWIMNNTTAMRLSLMMNPLGQPEFPTITPTGGTWMGYPVVASEAVPAGSDGGLIIFLNQSDVFLSEEGLVIDVSREASLQMDSAPDNPGSASTVMVSLWQKNLIGLRAERFINWKRRRDTAVGMIESVNYGE